MACRPTRITSYNVCYTKLLRWGVELALDAFQLGLRNKDYKLVGELTSLSLMPQVRYRQPFLNNRLVPYLVLGVGPSFLQFNDRKSAGFGKNIVAEDSYNFV